MFNTIHTPDIELKNFLKVPEPSVIHQLLHSAFDFKSKPFSQQQIGTNKTLVLLFFNPSLRTRLSTQKAAFNLGMKVIDINAQDGWKLEFEEDIVMDLDKAEHVKEAAQVISQYADIIGIRSFPSLSDRTQDYSDQVLKKFTEFASVPVISLESAIRHPLQSLADLMTIETYKKTKRPKVVLSWAPHPKALPQAVANSFVEWMQHSDVDLVVTHPEGYELAPAFYNGVQVTYNQAEAFKHADFVYAKNWSCYQDYGKIKTPQKDWMITQEKLSKTNDAYFMHCLPVRRNVVVEDKVMDSPKSLVIQQAEHRTYAAQSVLYHLLKNEL